MNLCQHAGPKGKKCDKPISHDGLHMLIENMGDSVSESGVPETNISISAWNNKGETFSESAAAKSKEVMVEVAEDAEKLIDNLIADAKASLKPGQVFEIRGCLTLAFLCWYWLPSPAEVPQGFEGLAMVQAPLFRSPAIVLGDTFNAATGIHTIARLEA